MQNNLSSILVHDFKYPKVYKNGNKKCKKMIVKFVYFQIIWSLCIWITTLF